MSKRETRKNIAAAQRGLCWWCRHPMTMRVGCEATATIDHLTPRKNGGDNSRGNLVAACHRCNQLRGHMPWPEFLAWVQIAPLPPPKITGEKGVGKGKQGGRRISASEIGLHGDGGWSRNMPKPAYQPRKSVGTLADIWPGEKNEQP